MSTLQLAEKWNKMKNTSNTVNIDRFRKDWGLGEGKKVSKAKTGVHISCKLPENSTL